MSEFSGEYSHDDDAVTELRLAALDHAIERYAGPADDTVPVLRQWADALRAHLAGDPELIVMQVEITDGEEEIVVQTEEPHASYWSFYKDGDFVIVCPHKDCVSTEFYEVDRGERWNPMVHDDRAQVQGPQLWEVVSAPGEPTHYGWGGPNPYAGFPILVTSENKNRDFHTDHFMCQACHGRVSLPECLESEWS